MDGYTSAAMQGQSFANIGQGYVRQPQDTSAARTSANQVIPAQLLTELKEGDTFQGEIMSVNGQEVQLQLVNGQYMTAKLEVQMQLALGQILNFEVQSNQNNRIVLKPLYTNLLQQQVGEAALRAASLPVNRKNLQLVSALIENGISIDKNNLPKLYRQVMQNPQAPMTDVLQLNKLNIPVTETNLQQYAQYKGMEHQLMGGIQTTAKEVVDLFQNMLTESVNQSGQEGVKPAVQYMDKVLAFLADETIQTQQPQQAQQPMSAAMPFSPENTESSAGTPQPLVQTPEENQQQSQPQAIAAGQETAQQEYATGTIADNGRQTAPAAAQSAQQADMTPLAAPMPENTQPQKNQTEVDLNSQLKQILEKKSPEREAIYQSEHFRETLTKALAQKWTLEPKDVGDKDKVAQFYRRLSTQSEQLSQLMQEADTNHTAGGSARNIHENISFMNELNQTFQYVQLPLRLSGRNANGELYVYTNKKNLAKKEGTLTALLHLDMTNLGAVDVKISLETEKNKLTTRFSMEEDMIDFMEAHMEELTERLKRAGYVCKTYVEPRQESRTPIQTIEEQTGAAAASLSYQAFDIKA